MKIVLSIVFIGTFLIGKSQTWPEPDAKWTYCNRMDNLIAVGLTVYEYTHDSLAEGTEYAVVRPSTWYEDPQTYQEALQNDRVLLFRQSNDTIYRRVAEVEYIFFINGLEVGESFTTFRSSLEHPNQYSCQPELILEVVEENPFEINGEIYRLVTMEDIYFDEVYTAIYQPRYFSFIEGIGLLDNFPYSNSNADILNTECMDFTDGTMVSTLREYISEFNDWVIGSLPCEPSSTVNRPAESFEFYPNPASDQIFWKGRIDAVTIIDVQGKTVLQNNRTSNFQSLPIRHLEPGIYTVKAWKGHDLIGGKLVVNR